MSASRKRVRRSDVTPEDWLTHRKLRKKIASAKWYAKKKQTEIEEEHRVRAELAEKLLPKPEDPIWKDPDVYAHWHASLDYECRGFPLRPSKCPVQDWIRGTHYIQDWLVRILPLSGDRGCDGTHIPWNSARFGRVWRRVAMGEWMESLRTPGRTFLGWTVSVVGAAFVAWQLQQAHLSFEWREVARAIHHVVTTNTMNVQTHPIPVPHNSPPNQNPTKKEDRTIDHPMSHTHTWAEFRCWMNTNLFDPCWTTEWNDEGQLSLTTEFDSTECEDDEDTLWMDEYMQPFLRCELQPSSLDQFSDAIPIRGTYAHWDHIDGQSNGSPSHSSDDQSECWIFDNNNPPSTNGSDDPEVHGRGSPTNA